MRRFILKIALFPTILLVLLAIIILAANPIVVGRNFKNNETESNGLVVKDTSHYDLGFLGISHARNFSRHGNHQRVENILDMNVLNLGQGSGICGVNEQQFYLQEIYADSIKLDHIFYVISPPFVFGDYLNYSARTFKYEPFDKDFLLNYLDYEADNKRERLVEYLRFKANPQWIFYKPFSLNSKNDSLLEVNHEAIEKGFEAAYLDTNRQKAFDKNIERIEQTVQLANEHNTEMIFLVTPTLFGQWEGHDECIEFAREMQKKYNCRVYDFSEVMDDPHMYYDHHHLNSNGIEYFTRNYLRPLFK